MSTEPNVAAELHDIKILFPHHLHDQCLTFMSNMPNTPIVVGYNLNFPLLPGHPGRQLR
ncbi:hypothetical protein [Pusillimonas sp.]|uniref:hypothetical protein n=1 Tax=Pusillimonas sp. TaxID=3040095 RepID=UPI0037CC7F4A